MKRIGVIALALLFLVPITALSQPTTPRDKVSTKIPANIRAGIDSLYSSERSDRIEAAYRLGERGAEAAPATGLLIEMFAAESSGLIGIDASQEGYLGGRTSVIASGRDLYAWDPVQLVAAGAVARIGESALEALAEGLGQTEKNGAYYCVVALAKMDRPDAGELIANFMAKADAKVREQIVSALQFGITDRALELLIQGLGDEEPGVRKTAAQSLRWAEDHRAVEALIAALEDSESDVQERAARSLEAITGQDFGLDVEKWSHWLHEQEQ